MPRAFSSCDGAPRLKAAFAALAMSLILAVVGPAAAGPPYLSDDPEPTDPGHWEIYNFATGAHGAPGLAGAAGLDLNYGGAKDLQLTMVLPVGFDDAGSRGLAALHGGFGDVELAAKYRFTHQAPGGWLPDLSAFPRLYAPTGDRRFGSSHVGLLLPVWAQKDFGAWSMFGGGGYQINPGAGRLNFWQGGVALARALTPRLQLGAEVFAQGDDAPGDGGYVTTNFGVVYRLVEHWSLLASAGPSWNHRAADGEIFYVSLKADY